MQRWEAVYVDAGGRRKNTPIMKDVMREGEGSYLHV